MIGVIAREPVTAAPYIEALSRQARSGVESPHADGCCAAMLVNGHWLHMREQCGFWESQLTALGDVRSTVLLLHARKASDPTSINLTKLHPFCRPGFGPGLMFCQNGTIRRHQNLRSRLDASAIDTEKYFDLVVRQFDSTHDLGQAITGAATEIQESDADATSLNALLSDGCELVAYKGRILPENAGYHTLFVREEPGLTVVSTEQFGMPGAGSWRSLEGVFRASFSREYPA